MKKKIYSIFGAGAAGLYTAWRLLDGKPRHKKDQTKQLAKGDRLELFDWGHYDFSKASPGTRAPGARVCTWHYDNDKTKSYVELGGMRYLAWDTTAKDPNGGKASGHRLVTTVLNQLGMDQYSVPFNESDNQLFYLRAKNFYLNDISSTNPAPYNVGNYGAAAQPTQGFNIVEALAVTSSTQLQTRSDWDKFYAKGRIKADLPESSVFRKGDLMADIGYWNLMYDQLGSEGYNYSADGNGYTSNVINWNSAVAVDANNEFTPGTQYKTITTGYSGMFEALFEAIVKLARQKGVEFRYSWNTRLHSILAQGKVIHYTCATREKPWQKASSGTADAAWLAMPRSALDLVAQATRFEQTGKLDVLNHRKVQLYLEAAVMQPSYKVGMFFKDPWWLQKATYPPKLESYVVTTEVIATLQQKGFPAPVLAALAKIALENPHDSAIDFVKRVEDLSEQRLTVPEEHELVRTALRNSIGPSMTDTPIRMVVYFGNNAKDQEATPVYGILASYDDEQFTTFWRELELGPEEQRTVPLSENVEPLQGPKKVPARMVKMLRRQLAELHFGPNSDFNSVPEPIDAKYVDWSLPPFNAGYHAWAAHYDVADVQQKIRKPSQLIKGADANIFIVGEAYSNDQAWVEGAYCTAESVLNEFFGMEPIIDDTHYPFICRHRR